MVPGVPSVSVEDFQRPLRGVILSVTLVVGFHFHRLHRQVTTALNGAFLVPGGGCLGAQLILKLSQIKHPES